MFHDLLTQIVSGTVWKGGAFFDQYVENSAATRPSPEPVLKIVFGAGRAPAGKRARNGSRGSSKEKAWALVR